MPRHDPERYDLDDRPKHQRKAKKHEKRFGFEEVVERITGWRHRRWFRTAKARDQALQDLLDRVERRSPLARIALEREYRKIER